MKSKNNKRKRVNPKYKDRVFKFIFGNPANKEWTLALYNSINGSNHSNPDDIFFFLLKMREAGSAMLPAPLWLVFGLNRHADAFDGTLGLNEVPLLLFLGESHLLDLAAEDRGFVEYSAETGLELLDGGGEFVQRIDRDFGFEFRGDRLRDGRGHNGGLHFVHWFFLLFGLNGLRYFVSKGHGDIGADAACCNEGSVIVAEVEGAMARVQEPEQNVLAD